MLWLLLVVLIPTVSDAAMTCPTGATCKYVRPADDGNGTDLNYGAEDGTSEEAAFDGFADITGLSAGDTVCLPGSDEPFFETLDTTTEGVTYAGCGDTQALIWSANGLSGNRSFDVDLAPITGESYAWTALGSDIYKKKIDVFAYVLWEDDTWLTPLVLYAASESTILGTLQAGQWTYKDNGDLTGTIYYRGTLAGNSPTNTVIRTNYIPSILGTPPQHILIDVDRITMRNIEMRGAERSAALAYSLLIKNASGTTLDDMTFYRNQIGPATLSTTSAINDTLLRNVTSTYNSNVALVLDPGTPGINRFRVEGGSYSYSAGAPYSVTAFSSGDGDGIGIGQQGGTAADVTIIGVTANGNLNAGVFIGTTSAMTLTNLYIRGGIFIDNTRGCVQEADTVQIVGIFSVTGFLCQGSRGGDSYAPFRLSSVPDARTVTIANGTFTDNTAYCQIDMKPNANTTYKLHNLVFYANPVNSGSVDGGDLYFHETSLLGTETFTNIWFYSRPNTHTKFAQIGGSGHRYYDSSSDFTNWSATTGESGSVINTNPLLTTDYKPTATSALRGAGTAYTGCLDARGRVCPADSPNIGAYQSTSGDPAAPRAARIQ